MTDAEFLRWVADLYKGWNDKDADGIAGRLGAIADRLEKLETETKVNWNWLRPFVPNT